MAAQTHDIQSMLRRLEALSASGVLTQAEAVSCAGLAEALRRPARVAILGQSASDVSGVLRAMLGEEAVSVQPDGPAIELSFGEAVQHTATFEDGSSLSQEGFPNENLMRHGPLFLQLEAPFAMLDTMSFLALELGEDAESYAPALRWAAKRSEIAILCAEGFGDVEAALWAAAPDRLKNHCYLVTTGVRDPASARARGLFDAVMHAPDPSEASPPLSVLKRRLAADISDARQEDVDAAALFLHRFPDVDLGVAARGAFDEIAFGGAADEDEDVAVAPKLAQEEVAPPADLPPVPSPTVEDTAQPPQDLSRDAAPDVADVEDEAEGQGANVSAAERAAAETANGEVETPAREDAPEDDLELAPRTEGQAAIRKLVSKPILHLKRRSRALAEILEWREEEEDWSEEVLSHCAETAETLRDLASAWPDDEPAADRLRDAIDQACDSVVLLQVEAGPDQAEDAARVLYQLRTDFEQAMAA